MLSEFINHHLQVVSAFGDNFYMLLIVLCFVVTFLMVNNYRKSAFLIITTLFSYVYSVALKGFFRLSRPPEADLSKFIGVDAYGFPSSHVVVYTVFWGFIIYLTFKYAKKFTLLMHVVRAFSVYIFLAVSISRVYLGYHYLRDVIGGYAFGIIFLLAIIYLDKKECKVTSKNKKKD